MARKLKTFVTTSGFFDIAVAAPTKKAASEILGVKENAFAHGFVKETDDPAIVSATLQNPGVILRRAVGSKKILTLHADLPKLAALEQGARQPLRKSARTSKARKLKRSANPTRDRRSAELYDMQERRRERQRAKEDAARAKRQKKRDAAVAKALKLREAARGSHDKRLAALENEREKIDAKIAAENRRWDREKNKHDAAVERAEG